MSFNVDGISGPAKDLQYFSPLTHWILGTIRHRLSELGVKVLKPLPDPPAVKILPSKQIPSSTSYPNPPDAELDIIKLVIDQVGWLTWNDYLHLLVASHCGGTERATALFDWTRDRKRLHQYLHFVRLLMKLEIKLKPFKPVFKKVIRRYLLEVEMRKKYNSIVGKRYRDFRTSGRSLDFEWEDIEAESKEIALGSTQKDGKDDIAATDQDESSRATWRGESYLGVS
jgi:hypothetical protein